MESEELDGGARHPGAVGQGEVGQSGQADRNLNSEGDAADQRVRSQMCFKLVVTLSNKVSVRELQPEMSSRSKSRFCSTT